MDELPVRIDAAEIPADFLEAFRSRDCSQLDCAECGYCGRIAERAIRVDAAFRERSLAKYQSVERAMATGSLWGL